MRTLLIMRHAKSGWDVPGLDDHERPLARRGTRDAPRLARYIAREALLPDVVLCSDAVRTRATLALLLAEWAGPAPRIIYDATLYLAEPADIMDAVRKLDATAHRCLILGHNPGVHELALGLTGGGDRKALTELAMRFPTSGLAVLELDEAEDWFGIRPGSGRLKAFVYPKVL